MAIHKKHKRCNTNFSLRNNHRSSNTTSLSSIHIDDVQIKVLVDALSESVNKALNKSVEELSVVLSKENQQRRDFFSLIIKVALSFLFWLAGILLAISTILNWTDFWTGGLHNFGVIILLIYCVIFIILGIDILFEKDRNYLISIFSSFVGLVALAITLFK